MIGLFQDRHALPLILQSEVSECGLACLAMIASYHGKRVDIASLRNRFQVSAAGASVKHLLEEARGLALQGRALKLELADIHRLALPVVLHWDMDHFVVLKRVGRRRITIHDPAIGLRHYRPAELNYHFTGIAIELTPQTSFTREDLRASLSLRQLLPRSRAFYQSMQQIFVLSFLLQLLSLLSPLYLQLVIDQGIGRNDMDLIPLLACLFLIVVISKTLASYFRGLLSLQLSNTLGFQLLSNGFAHLLQLSLGFFERREMGDIVSRFSALENIKQLVTQELITVVVDGLFSTATLVLLFLYSPLLAWVALGFMAAFALVRSLSIASEKRRRQDALVSGARQHTRFMENIRAITTIKNYGLEQQRVSDWQGAYAESVNANYHLGRFQLGLGTLQGLLFGLDNLLTIYLGATLVGAGAFTVGQLMSFIFLKQHFTSAITAMLPKLAELRLMKLELERVADFCLEKPEFPVTEAGLRQRRPDGAIRLRNLSFRYSATEPLLFDRLNLAIAPGSSTAILGQSGCGKSTLLKLLLGLERPLSGDVLIDGMPLPEFGIANLRGHVAAIMHNEGLLAGDLAYNIRLDSTSLDLSRLEEACERAGILGLINALPLGFSTRVGEMGSVFSAGQIQRLLLARAYYRQPQILVLDEALSHLGREAEREVFQSIIDSGTTVILVTHNVELARLASNIINLSPIRLKEERHAPAAQSP